MNRSWVLGRSSFIGATEIWIVPTVAIASLLLSRALLVVVLLFIFYRLFQWWKRGVLSVRTPIDSSILLLVGTIPVTFWATVQPEITHLQVYRLLSGISVLYCFVNGLPSRLSLRYCLGTITLVGIGLALLAPFTVEWITDKFSFLPLFLYTAVPFFSTSQIHPNVIAGTLALLLPVFTSLLLFGWRELTKLEKSLYGVAIAFMGVILLFTQSRGALTGVIVAILVLFFLYWRRGWQVILLMLGALFLIVAYRGKLDIFVDSTALTTVRGWAGRQEIWSRALAIIHDFPLTGIGMGNFGLVADTFYPFLYAAPGQTPHAHNLFLQIAVDLGIPGLIIWLSILFNILVLSCQLLIRGRLVNDCLLTGLGAGLLCSQLLLIIHGLTDAVLWGTKPAVILWALWGVALVATNLSQPSSPAVSAKTA